MQKHIYANVAEALGLVPIVRLNRTTSLCQRYEIYMKLESCNPGGSIKEKNAAYMIHWAEQHELLLPGGVIVESSSGNFGIGLAMIGAARGYRVMIVVDAKTPPPVRRMLKAYGAELVDVPLSEADASGSMQKARMKRARELSLSIPGAWYPCQHLNPANIEAHTVFTACEIDEEFGGNLEAIVIGVSTAGQIMGIARHYKRCHPHVQIVGVDVSGSVIFGGEGKPYKMTGVGLSFTPPNLRTHLLNAAYVVPESIGYSVCHRLAHDEGLLLGASTGIITAAALNYVSRLPQGARVLIVNPDRGDRYLETVYSEEWIRTHGFQISTPEILEQEILRLEPIDLASTKNATAEIPSPFAF